MTESESKNRTRLENRKRQLTNPALSMFSTCYKENFARRLVNGDGTTDDTRCCSVLSITHGVGGEIEYVLFVTSCLLY